MPLWRLLLALKGKYRWGTPGKKCKTVLSKQITAKPRRLASLITSGNSFSRNRASGCSSHRASEHHKIDLET